MAPQGKSTFWCTPVRRTTTPNRVFHYKFNKYVRVNTNPRTKLSKGEGPTTSLTIRNLGIHRGG